MEKTKVCSECRKESPLSDYYKSDKMADGYTAKCKVCSRKATKARRDFLTKTSPEWVEKEAERHREKSKKRYLKLKGDPKLYAAISEGVIKWEKKFPEKLKAQRAVRGMAYWDDAYKTDKNNHRHHWSYKEENWLDVFHLHHSDHYFIHRYLKYSPDHKCYKTPDGVLLDTREKHEQFIMKVLELKSK